jgi:hypothetical protein
LGTSCQSQNQNFAKLFHLLNSRVKKIKLGPHTTTDSKSYIIIVVFLTGLKTSSPAKKNPKSIDTLGFRVLQP